MTRVETQAIVGKDRTVTIQLPDDVTPGEHRLVVLLDDTDQVEQESDSTQPLVRKGNVLVYAGTLAGEIESTLEQIRNERTEQLLRGTDE